MVAGDGECEGVEDEGCGSELEEGCCWVGEEASAEDDEDGGNGVSEDISAYAGCSPSQAIADAMKKVTQDSAPIAFVFIVLFVSHGFPCQQ